MPNLGADMACDYVICNETPDDDGIADCKALGKGDLIYSPVQKPDITYWQLL